MLDLEKTIMKSEDRALRRQLVKLLGWQDAHLSLDAVIRRWPVKLRQASGNQCRATQESDTGP